jgi:hypothetical protein
MRVSVWKPLWNYLTRAGSVAMKAVVTLLIRGYLGDARLEKNAALTHSICADCRKGMKVRLTTSRSAR